MNNFGPSFEGQQGPSRTAPSPQGQLQNTTTNTNSMGMLPNPNGLPNGVSFPGGGFPGGLPGSGGHPGALGLGGIQGSLPGLMAGLPTPAGHQSDIAYVYTMVEELSRVLEQNRAQTERINNAVGRVRGRAMEMGMTGEGVLGRVAGELNDTSRNLATENAHLLSSLTHLQSEHAATLALCNDYARVIGDMLERLHAFKLKTTMDMAAWHRSYRDQLSREREENVQLRTKIADMAAAGERGNRKLREFRRRWDVEGLGSGSGSKNKEVDEGVEVDGDGNGNHDGQVDMSEMRKILETVEKEVGDRDRERQEAEWRERRKLEDAEVAGSGGAVGMVDVDEGERFEIS